MKTQMVENGFDLHIPMALAVAKPAQRALEGQYSSLVASGSLMGGLTTVILLRGRMP
jgi:hypothetical protein